MARYTQQGRDYQLNKIDYHVKRLEALGVSHYAIAKRLDLNADDLMLLLQAVINQIQSDKGVNYD